MTYNQIFYLMEYGTNTKLGKKIFHLKKKTLDATWIITK